MSTIRPAFHRHVQERKKRLLLLIGLFLLLILAVILMSLAILNPAYTFLEEDGYSGVIFSGKKAADLLGVMLISDRTEELYWTPSRNVIRDMERRLKAYVRDELPEISPNLSDFRRQYFGFKRHDNRSILLIGFCEPLGVEWRQVLVALPDSPACYLEAQYDVENDVLLYAWTSFGQ